MRIIVSIIFYFIFLVYFPEKSFLVFLKEKCHYKRLTVPSTRGYCSTVDLSHAGTRLWYTSGPIHSRMLHMCPLFLSHYYVLAGQRLFRKAVSHQLKLRWIAEMQQCLFESPPHQGDGGVRNFSLMLGCWERLCTYRRREYPIVHYCALGGMCHSSTSTAKILHSKLWYWNISSHGKTNSIAGQSQSSMLLHMEKYSPVFRGNSGRYAGSQPSDRGEAEAWPPLWPFQMIIEFFHAAERPARSFTVSYIVKLSHDWHNALESSRNTLVPFQVLCSTVSAVRNRLSVPDLLICPSHVDLQICCQRKVLGYMANFLAAWKGRRLTVVSFKFGRVGLITALSVARVGHPAAAVATSMTMRCLYGPKGKRKYKEIK